MTPATVEQAFALRTTKHLRRVLAAFVAASPA
jgi:hypothetical protein